MVGCIGKLYESVENLDDTYILQCNNKEIFLKPKASKVPISMLTDRPTQKSIPVAIKNPKFASPMVPEGGFVKDVTYMVMDDLVVKPLSTIFILNLLNQYDVKESAALQGKEVYLGMDEALKLLKGSLHSDKVLTTVFLSNEYECKNVTIPTEKVDDDGNTDRFS
ncbi:uncharacterized protein Fot_31136 [Forsythia ovata]|uniref:Uncharacterized protein n=1 Tax=Forsythia ovata TaxID=205694 RepID=A0ABD1T455_9LAMI